MRVEDLQPRAGDMAFSDSPDAGELRCLCSRCGRQIPEDEAPVTRVIDFNRNLEWRYCQRCVPD